MVIKQDSQSIFANVQLDPKIQIQRSVESKVDSYSVLYQSWHWNNIGAENFIFVGEEVAHLDDENLEILVRSSSLCRRRSELAIRHDSKGFVIVSFNFFFPDLP